MVRKLLTYNHLISEKGITYSRVHLRRLELAGKFPRSVKLGDGPQAKVAWIESEVDAWIDELAAKRDDAAA